MILMGRPKTVHPNLPPRMTARKGRYGLNYYYTAQGKRFPLGHDLNRARLKWAELENGIVGNKTRYVEAADRYEAERLKNAAPKTQGEYTRALKLLREAFKGFLLDQIEPKHVRQYLDRRTKKVSGNREIAVLSAVWNFAREVGLTDKANPCTGVKRHKEESRSRYVTDGEYTEVWNKASATLQDAMDLLLLTGQRPSDVLKMTRQDIREGVLWVRQGKTKELVGISIEGELQVVLERILARPRAIQTMFLVAGKDGQRWTIWQLEGAFDKAREGADWQLRDLRAKSSTDTVDLSAASTRLGHASEATTAKIYRRIKGRKARPLR